MRTDAAVLFEVNQPLCLLSLDLPDLKPGQVLVEVAYSGVCHSQLHEVRGRRGPDRFLPHTLGHEGSGTVLAIGSGVTKVTAGDRVVLTWIKGEGADVPSTTYGGGPGRVNSGAISTFMRHTITCENRLVVLPSDMPLREAGCSTAPFRPGPASSSIAPPPNPEAVSPFSARAESGSAPSSRPSC